MRDLLQKVWCAWLGQRLDLQCLHIVCVPANVWPDLPEDVDSIA